MIDDNWDIKLIDEIHNDVNEARSLLDVNETPFIRRMYIRAVFAAIEGTCYTLRTDIINDIETKKHKIPFADEAMLREETYSLNKQSLEGEVNTRYIPLDTILLFTFKHLTTFAKVSYDIDKSTNGWRSFKQALRTRNRITHPRSPDDFSVSHSELVDTINAYDWFWKIYSDTYKLMIEKKKREIVNLKPKHSSL